MSHSRRCWCAAVTLLLVGAGAARLAADDWPQFRKDAGRSAASSDRVRFPMTEIWSWTTTHTLGHSPLYNSVVWQGRVLFTACEGANRFLICSEARTGSVLWRQPLAAARLTSPLSDSVGPSVTRGGVVFAYDEMALPQVTGHSFAADLRGTRAATFVQYLQRRSPELAALYLRDVQRQDITRQFGEREAKEIADEARRTNLRLHLAEALFAAARIRTGSPRPTDAALAGRLLGLTLKATPRGGLTLSGSLGGESGQVQIGPVLTLCVRTFDVQTGLAGPVLPLPKARFDQDLMYTVLHHPPLTHYLGLTRSDQVAVPGLGAEALGPPLLLGDEFIATGMSELFVRWRAPDLTPNLGKREIGVHHPLPGIDPNLSNWARFGGFPPVPVSGGIVVGEDSSHRFLGTLEAVENAWHRDVRNTLGIPAVGSGSLYVGVGGMGASRGIMSVDASSGTPHWAYAPSGLPPDAVRTVTRPSLDTSFVGWYLGPAAPDDAPRNPNGSLGAVELNPVTPPRIFRSQRLLNSLELVSPFAPGHWSSGGLVVNGGLVYGEADGTIVALNDATGAPKWRHALPPRSIVRSLVGTREHLIACVSVTRGGREPVWASTGDRETRLVALRLEDGKPVWEEQVERAGNLVAADGLVFFTNGSLRVYGPAERTFRLAVDSSERSDYRLRAPEAPLAEPAPAPAPGEPASMPAQPSEQAVADAAIVRLTWGVPVGQMVERVRARRTVAPPGTPLVLSLDRLNATRTAWTDAATQRPFTAEWQKEYAAVCAQLAAAARPEHFDILPEINAYLARAPQDLAEVRELIRTVVPEVRRASPNTRVSVSLNCELLAGRYGRGDYRPFGPPPDPGRVTLAQVLEIAALVDEVGLTSYPQAAFLRPADMPPDYLLSARKVLNGKPVLLTRMAVKLDEKVPTGQLLQAWLVRRILQNCYWLEAPVVAYPDLVVEEKTAGAAPLALRVGKEPRTGLATWQEVIRRPLVGRIRTGEDKEPDP
jgi:outer membrane protein assembly factor BamB